MQHRNSVFHQITKHIPWDVFDGAVLEHKSDHRVRKLRTRDQFLALLYGQLAGAVSLREIEHGLQSHQNRLYHAGARPISRSTLADANAKRPAQVYGDVFGALIARAKPGLRRKLRGAVRLIDATRVALSCKSADWTPKIKDHYAAKVHVVYDPLNALPLSAKLTAQNVNDITPAKALPIEQNVTYVFDLAYYSYDYWHSIHTNNSRFVTRLKTHTKLRDTKQSQEKPQPHILLDQTGLLSKRSGSGSNPYTDRVREIHVRRDDGRILRLATNDLHTPADEIAELYKLRWQIELFFKWLKQNLNLKRFLGLSENAVKIQIYVALIAFLLLRATQRLQKAITKPQAFARLIRLNIMHRKPITNLLKPPDEIQNKQLQLNMEPT